jgi:hypothetical protein
MAKFDAYSATIREQELPNIAETLAFRMGGTVAKGSKMRRFGEVLNIEVAGHAVGWLGENESDTDRFVYLEAKGQHTPILVQHLRRYFPDHSVPRCDVAEDYDGEGVYDQLVNLTRAHKGKRTNGHTQLPDRLEDGRTYNAGRRGNSGYMRIYEKGKQKENQRLGRPNWVRAEAEIRPQYSIDKSVVSGLTPLQCLGLVPWVRTVWEALLEHPVERYEPEIRNQSHERTMLFIARNYRRFLEAQLEDGIDIVRTWQQVWKEDDEAEANWHRAQAKS